MKTSTIGAVLGAIILISAIPGIQAELTDKTMQKIASCHFGTPQCQKVAEKLNQMILTNPKADPPTIQFIGADSWMQILPERTLKIYSLYHPEFYYGQKIPVGQQTLYCYGCDIETALKAQDLYKVKLIIA